MYRAWELSETNSGCAVQDVSTRYPSLVPRSASDMHIHRPGVGRLKSALVKPEPSVQLRLGTSGCMQNQADIDVSSADPQHESARWQSNPELGPATALSTSWTSHMCVSENTPSSRVTHRQRPLTPNDPNGPASPISICEIEGADELR
eukprot:1245453-Rhodomonas_salina.1